MVYTAVQSTIKDQRIWLLKKVGGVPERILLLSVWIFAAHKLLKQLRGIAQ
jgi:hypothetical protein